jgi:hypothetical protein
MPVEIGLSTLIVSEQIPKRCGNGQICTPLQDLLGLNNREIV